MLTARYKIYIHYLKEQIIEDIPNIRERLESLRAAISRSGHIFRRGGNIYIYSKASS